MPYNWELTSWPNFVYNIDKHKDVEARFLRLSGQNEGVINVLNDSERKESILNLMVREALKSSEIEGEMISRADLVSSIRKNLGYNSDAKFIKDKRSIGIAETIVRSRENFKDKLTSEMLFEWHRSILGHNSYIHLGQWRTHPEPMQIVSGSMNNEIIHYEAPPSSSMEFEMNRFINWFNSSEASQMTPIIRSSIAHLYFESIHPFEDGNGRIGRIIAEKALSQSIGYPILMSLSHSITKDKKSYYEALKVAQRTLEIDDWIQFFGKTIVAAQEQFYVTMNFSIKKMRFFDKVKTFVNENQQKVLNKMLESEDEFLGGMNATKFMSITKVSKATATRNLSDMVGKNILISKGLGRSTNYQVNLDF